MKAWHHAALKTFPLVSNESCYSTAARILNSQLKCLFEISIQSPAQSAFTSIETAIQKEQEEYL